MIYCYKCEKHGEFDVDLSEPKPSVTCPTCGKKAKKVFKVNFEGHYSMEHWAKDDPKSRESIADMVDDAPGYEDIEV